MFCCDLSPRVAPSPEGEKCSSYLRLATFGHVIMAVLYFFGSSTGSFAINDLLMAWIAYMAYKTYDYTNVTIYVWLLIMSMMYLITAAGTYVQFFSEIFSGGDSDGKMMNFVIYLVELLFYCAALYVAHRAYKEFKALALYLPYGECMFSALDMG